jgi:methionyl-tRNA formyltransferase
VTIMQMDEGLDTGAMLLAGRVKLGPRATASWLHDQLSGMGARLVLRVLEEAPTPVPQPQEGATYAAKLTREDGAIDCTRDAAAIDRQVRALNPWPGTFCHLGQEVLKVLEAEPASGSGIPGTVLDAALTVACGSGALRVLRLQRAGRAAMPAEAFLRGHALPPGTLLS